MTLGRTRAIDLATAGIRCASVNNDGLARPPRLAIHGWASKLRQDEGRAEAHVEAQVEGQAGAHVEGQLEAHAGSTRGRVGLIADVSLG